MAVHSLIFGANCKGCFFPVT